MSRLKYDRLNVSQQEHLIPLNMHLSTINTGDISNHDKRPLSNHTSLVYPPLRAAAMLEDAWTRVHASSVAPVINISTTWNIWGVFSQYQARKLWDVFLFVQTLLYFSCDGTFAIWCNIQCRVILNRVIMGLYCTCLYNNVFWTNNKLSYRTD